MLACVCFYSLRVNMSFSIVCMLNHTALAAMSSAQLTNRSENASYTCATASTSSAFHQDGELTWSKEQQGLLLGSTFWGYILTNIAGGLAATRYGGKRVIGGALFCAAILTGVTPAAAQRSLNIVLVIRFFIGVCLGCISPALQALFVQWAPPQESSTLRSLAFAGCQMGYILTFPMSAFLCEYGFAGGWPSLFYIQSGLVMVWFLAWTLLVTDSPMDHPHISSKERDYIASSLRETVSLDRVSDDGRGPCSQLFLFLAVPWLGVRLFVCHADVLYGISNTLATIPGFAAPILMRKQIANMPWNEAFSSKTVWACIICHICFNWGEYTFLTNIPTYLREVLHFDIKANGLLSSLPYIGFWIVINVSSYLADFCCRMKVIGTTETRKLFNTVGMFVPAGLLVGMAFLDCTHSVAAVALLTLGISLTGCSYGGGLYISFSDISGRHAGVLYGISNTLATIPGFAAPILIGHITQDKTQEQWRWVFFLAAFLYLLGGSGFILFGSGQLQPWAAQVCDKVVNDTDLCKPLNENSFKAAEKVGEEATRV